MPTDVEAIDVILGGIEGPPGPTGPPGPAVDPSTALTVASLTVTTDASIGGDATVGDDLVVVGDLTAGTVRANTAVFEAGRMVGMGYWQNEPFNAANFTATNHLQVAVGAWTLTALDQLVLRWTLIGKTMLVAWNLAHTSVTATPNLLCIKIPGGFIASGLATGTGSNNFLDNDVPGEGPGTAFVIPSDDQILLQKPGGVPWAVSAHLTNSRGSIVFEIA